MLKESKKLLKVTASLGLVLGLSVSNLYAKKKGYFIDFGVQYGTSTTVSSKYDFTNEINPDFKLPSEGSKVKGQNNPMNLSLNKEGTIVTDHNTKLQWASRTLLVWTNILKAREYCSNIRTGGYDDWRLPTIKELVSVADYNIFEPTFSRKFFPGVPTIPSGYWATPEGTGHAMSGWHVGFDGHIMGQPADATKMTRCVRGDNLTAFDKNDFVDNKDNTVTDRVTKLVWQQTDDNVKKDYKTAKKYCKNLELGGRSDWRLPHLKELVSVMDFNKFRPAMDEKFFKDIKPEFYWSSTLDPAFGTDTMSGVIGSTDGIPRAWAVETMSGAAWKYQVTSKYPVRCVTDAK